MPHSPELGRIAVLVVEDEPLVRMDIVDQLTDEGYAVFEAGVAGQLIVRMRRFGLGLAFNCENKDGRILKLTAFEKRLSISELGL